jgi:glycosyltransferase involved in cell wall biosynthesis
VAIIEALALGRPVISTYVAGIPELVQDGTSGWLVPAGSVDALVDAMRDALEKPTSELEQMGRHGAERARIEHDLQAEIAKLEHLVSTYVRRNSSSGSWSANNPEPA